VFLDGGQVACRRVPKLELEEGPEIVWAGEEELEQAFGRAHLFFSFVGGGWWLWVGETSRTTSFRRRVDTYMVSIIPCLDRLNSAAGERAARVFVGCFSDGPFAFNFRSRGAVSRAFLGKLMWVVNLGPTGETRTSQRDAGGEDSPLTVRTDLCGVAPQKRLKLDHGRPTQPTPANPTDGCEKNPRKIRPGPRFSLPGRLSATTRLGKDPGGQHHHRSASEALRRSDPRTGDKKIKMRYGTYLFSYSVVFSFGSGTLDIIIHACEICRRARWVLQLCAWVSPLYRVGMGF